MDTRNSLGIFWGFEDLDEHGKIIKYQDEVDGLTFFGYWKEGLPEKLSPLDSFVKLWKGAEVQAKVTKWDSENYRCYSVEIHIMKWPDDSDWEKNIRCSLAWFCDQGALMSWCGAEDCSPSIDVFDDSLSAGNIYAAYAPNIGFKCNSALFERYEELDKSQLKRFKEVLI